MKCIERVKRTSTPAKQHPEKSLSPAGCPAGFAGGPWIPDSRSVPIYDLSESKPPTPALPGVRGVRRICTM